MNPDQLQLLLAAVMEQQSVSRVSTHSDGPVGIGPAMRSQDGPITPAQTPTQPSKHRGFRPPSSSVSPSKTPSSKMASLSLSGNGTLSPVPPGTAAAPVKNAKVPNPTGYDPQLTYEHMDDTTPTPTPKAKGSTGRRNVIRVDDSDDEAPGGNRPEPVTPVHTRGTKRVSEASPPQPKKSPQKKVRDASPDASLGTKDPGTIKWLEGMLERARQGKLRKIPPVLTAAAAADFVDDEAVVSGTEDGGDEDRDLDGFIVPDDHIEYDDEVRSLPDDDNHGQTRKRLIKKSDARLPPGESEDSTVSKGKQRARPPSQELSPDDVEALKEQYGSDYVEDEDDAADATASASNVNALLTEWRTTVPPLSMCADGLYPGSSVVPASAAARDILPLHSTFDWGNLRSQWLANYGFYDSADVPADCAFSFEVTDDGWDNVVVDTLPQSNTVHIENVLVGLRFERVGPFINEATVNPADLVALETGTGRYRMAIRDGRAPAISITLGVVRFDHLDRPSQARLPTKFMTVSPFEGLFERSVALQCMVFGTPELVAPAWMNAFRFQTMPSFGGGTGAGVYL
ncbi:hypothetical protein BD626DRAFT_575848 [Schizophyllum amplum]|uniref:Uncharacterized protein n=1 Tax=Schizophyllum amplum TaxID=97359 RepID=A0A550BUV8_9AGAR|nr:hypothetical protein BD626DRAFT_575848 [Auriculariopsis ampla]